MQTSQEPPQDLAIYLGLQGFDVESMEVVSAPRLGALGRRIKVVHFFAVLVVIPVRTAERRTGRGCSRSSSESDFATARSATSRPISRFVRCAWPVAAGRGLNVCLLRWRVSG